MDELDKQIIQILRKKPTKPFLKVANEIGIASSTVQKRFEKLKEKKLFLVHP